MIQFLQKWLKTSLFANIKPQIRIKSIKKTHLKKEQKKEINEKKTRGKKEERTKKEI